MTQPPRAASAPRSKHEIPEAVARRALSRFVLDETTGCHLTTYSIGNHGYGQIGWQVGEGKNAGTTTQRAAWTAVHGRIPDGMTVDHTCKNRRCVNVAHLRLLPNFENARRTAGRDWPVGQCANGHGPEHLRQRANGRIRCDPCNQASQARYRAKGRAA